MKITAYKLFIPCISSVWTSGRIYCTD